MVFQVYPTNAYLMVKKAYHLYDDSGGLPGPPLQNSITLALSQREREFGGLTPGRPD